MAAELMKDSGGIEAEFRILIVEDEPEDELMEREIRKAGIRFTCRRVETAEAFVEALQEFRPDVVLSDFAMPQFNALEALQLTLKHTPLVPLIVVTGSIDEETAVQCLKAGASDYVIHGEDAPPNHRRGRRAPQSI